jgi:hypothetical protein
VQDVAKLCCKQDWKDVFCTRIHTRVVTWLTCPNELESYTSGSISYWQGHLSWAGWERRTGLRVAPSPPGWELGMGLTTPSSKRDNVENPQTMLATWNQQRWPSKYKDLRIGT